MANFPVRDLLEASNWSRLFFTTYALSVSFFEAIVLDAIVRQQIDSTLILADEAGVRSAFTCWYMLCSGILVPRVSEFLLLNRMQNY